jgi:hypothetical protein
VEGAVEAVDEVLWAHFWVKMGVSDDSRYHRKFEEAASYEKLGSDYG